MDFEEFKNQLRDCRFCRRFGIEPKPFVGKEKSEKSAKIVQVSQQPSKNASESGIPFFGRSGKTLIKWYDIEEKTFYNPKIFYITGMAHCHGPDNVAKQLRQACSKKWLEQELSFLDPRLYIILGKDAANFFFQEKNLKEPQNYCQIVFENHVLRNRAAFVLPHPSSRSTWLAHHPKFESDRLNDIRKAVHEAIREFSEKH